MKNPVKGNLRIVGIDPGKSGGIAVISEDKIKASKTPYEPIQMSLLITSAVNSAHIDDEKLIVYIENVHAFPTDGRSSAFKFGCNYGMWLGILAANNITPIKVSPFKWMQEFAPLPKIKKERKQMLKEIAQEMFPSIKVTLSTADAILIAVYGVNNE
tara:strand:- start:1782 stop:2252 length:471 start_codon:yes stop_codon:yes gene_type:complete